MTDHNQALDAAIVAAGLDPRNDLVRKSSQALVEKYIEARNGEAICYVSSKQLPHNPDHAYIACRLSLEGNFDTPLFAAPVSAGGEKVKAELVTLLKAMPKFDRGISWQLRNWNGVEEMTVYGATAKALKYVFDHTEALISALASLPTDDRKEKGR